MCFPEKHVMKIKDLPLEVTDWSAEEGERHAGETGHAIWKTRQFKDIRVRLVEYSPGYSADHWCSKGHILYCIAGVVTIRFSDGRAFQLHAAMSMEVEDDSSSHRLSTAIGGLLFIVD